MPCFFPTDYFQRLADVSCFTVLLVHSFSSSFHNLLQKTCTSVGSLSGRYLSIVKTVLKGSTAFYIFNNSLYYFQFSCWTSRATSGLVVGRMGPSGRTLCTTDVKRRLLLLSREILELLSSAVCVKTTRLQIAME